MRVQILLITSLFVFSLAIIAPQNASANAMGNGTVKLFNKTIHNGKGMGFITPSEGTRDLVFYSADVRAEHFEELEHGCEVVFEVIFDLQGRAKAATNIEIIECPAH